MKKYIIGSMIPFVLSANTSFFMESGLKDYKNSKTKIEGSRYELGAKQKYKSLELELGYSMDRVKRAHPISKKRIDTLIVKKYNIKAKQAINKRLSLTASFISIDDNLAPTDNGKIYGLGVGYTFVQKINTNITQYISDYEDFNVYQTDFSVFKGFGFKGYKAKVGLVSKYISIDGQKYANYSFKDKSYLTHGIKASIAKNGYFLGLGTFLGKRVFTVMNEGKKVQHHAMEQDKTYFAKIGKKFKNYDIVFKYSYQNGKELPENRDDVDTEVLSVSLNYKF